MSRQLFDSNCAIQYLAMAFDHAQCHMARVFLRDGMLMKYKKRLQNKLFEHYTVYRILSTNRRKPESILHDRERSSKRNLPYPRRPLIRLASMRGVRGQIAEHWSRRNLAREQTRDSSLATQRDTFGSRACARTVVGK